MLYFSAPLSMQNHAVLRGHNFQHYMWPSGPAVQSLFCDHTSLKHAQVHVQPEELVVQRRRGLISTTTASHEITAASFPVLFKLLDRRRIELQEKRPLPSIDSTTLTRQGWDSVAF